MGLALKDADSRFDGTVSAGISLERLSASIAAKQAELGGTVLLVSGRGKVLLAARQSRVRSP